MWPHQDAADHSTDFIPFSAVVRVLTAPGDPPIVKVQPAGSFTTTGWMGVTRTGHTATLLQDGRVLIAGGQAPAALGDRPDILSSAELFDPSTETFVVTGSLTSARTGHTATVLPDGRVLLAGGYGSSRQQLTNAEIYDPSTGRFTETGQMTSAQAWHTATLMRNGNILIAGGFAQYPFLATPQLYDPVTGTFTQAGSQTVSRFVCEWCSPAALLPDGKVLLGRSQPAQLYDPLADMFRLAGEMVDPDRFTATTLTTGNVLFTGGSWFGRSSTTELYDPVTDTFRSAASMADARGWQSATLLPDGTVLVAGGETAACSGGSCSFVGTLDSAELYDPTRNTFTVTGRMAVPREGHTSTLLNDGRVLVTGGVSYGGIGVFFGALASAELYRPQVLIPVPQLLTLSADGRGQGAILHAGTGRIVSAADPTTAGQVLEIYLTGLINGSVLPPSVVIRGRMAEVLSFRTTPGLEGLNRVDVRVPEGIEPGAEVGVRLMYNERTSNEVTIGVR